MNSSSMQQALPQESADQSTVNSSSMQLQHALEHADTWSSQLVMTSGNLLGMMLLDNDLVTMLSTNAQPGEVKTIRRKQSDGKLVDIQCPVSVLSYNTYMGGVDREDSYNIICLV